RLSKRKACLDDRKTIRSRNIVRVHFPLQLRSAAQKQVEQNLSSFRRSGTKDRFRSLQISTARVIPPVNIGISAPPLVSDNY
ncbi:hypothetical protein J6590_041855, partial [Homalodisca vitripennis]